jgi:hypothetical protein
MIDRLVCEILRQRRLIKEHIQVLSDGETQTRASLIDPMLRTLGWNVEDPSRVRLEFMKIDYVLLYDDGTPAAGLEAKKLHEKLDIHYNQLKVEAALLFRKYRTEYFILTNGNIWQLYRGITSRSDDVSAKRVFEVVVHPTPSVSTGTCAVALAQLWRPDYSVVPPVPAQDVRFWPNKSVPVTEGWIRMSIWTVSGKPNAILRFPNGYEEAIVNWNQLVPCIGDWLSRRQSIDLFLPVPSEDKKRYILSETAIHPSGRKFSRSARIRDKLQYDRVNRRAEVHLCDARQLLRHCGVDPGDILVRIGAKPGI